MIDVTIGIVTYNSADKICNLLQSIEEFTSLPNGYQVYVVDNCSTDNTMDLVKQNFPQVQVVNSPENRGFGFGHNQVIPLIESRYHAVVNPDIVLHENVFGALVSYLDEHPEAVLATPKVLSPDGSEQYLPKRLPTVKYMTLGRLSKIVKPLEKVRREYTRADEEFTEPTAIDFCTGCFMLMRTEAFKALGGFDDQFFMYCEDADLSRRLAQYGQLMFLPDVTVEHQWEQASGHSLKFLRIHLDSMRKYMRKVKQETGKGAGK